MTHDDHYTIKDYWSTNELYCTLFYYNVMKHDISIHTDISVLKIMKIQPTEQDQIMTGCGKSEDFQLSK
jgi:hypothetical protein